MKRIRRWLWLYQALATSGVLLLAASVVAQNPDGEPSELPTAQAELARRYEKLEATAARLAELSDASDPGRAQQLREAIRVGREQDIQTRFDSIVKLLEEERLAAAGRNQQELARQLEVLLEVLLAKPTDRRNDTEQEMLRKYARDIGRLIRAQRSLRARTQTAPKPAELAPQQQEICDKAGEVEKDLAPKPEDSQGSESSNAQDSSEASPESSKSSDPAEDGGKSQSSPGSEGNPSEGGQSPQPPGEKSPTEQAAERVASAKQRMQQAKQKLEADERQQASTEQTAAQRELEQAKDELERRLRQIREEEMQRTLLQLAARFRQMLEAQQQILAETQALHTTYGSQPDRELEIKSAGLAERERRLTRNADRAMLLLREDGTSVAFPEALGQIRDDMDDTTQRLIDAKVDHVTQALEQDIIDGLQEAVEAMEKAAENLANRQQQQQQGGQPGGQPPEEDLVDKLAELKLIRSLQLRINRRTEELADLIERGEVPAAEVQPLLARLAERQAKVATAARELHSGRND
ncbi:MAG: hypothetical protein WD851_05225 [Pirellulales bacterium]